MPGDSGVTVVTTLVCFFYFAREAAGASCARHSPRPLIGEGRTLLAKLGRIARRECEVISAVIARSEATKQSRLSTSLRQSWIASRSLSSGAHSRDPLARNDVLKTPYV